MEKWMDLASDPHRWPSWLERESCTGDPGVGGFDVRSWEDSTWILHAMYEVIDEAREDWADEGLDVFSRFVRPTFIQAKRVAWTPEITRNWGEQDEGLVEKFGFAPAIDWIFPEGFAWDQIPPLRELSTRRASTHCSKFFRAGHRMVVKHPFLLSSRTLPRTQMGTKA
jgi:hypothetical protein